MPKVGKYTVPYMDDMGNFNLQPENDSLQKKDLLSQVLNFRFHVIFFVFSGVYMFYFSHSSSAHQQKKQRKNLNSKQPV